MPSNRLRTRGRTPRGGNLRGVPIRVFHVDDSESYRLLVAQMLSPDDVEVVGGAGDPAAALSGVTAAQPDAVLLDQLGGAQLIEQLRAAVPGLRVVMLSGFSRESADPEAVTAADAYVEKSGDLHELCESVVSAVRG